eukprot:SAG11_NODE_37189_length_258_cov_0.641509_1_plen_41_part_01
MKLCVLVLSLRLRSLYFMRSSVILLMGRIAPCRSNIRGAV